MRYLARLLCLTGILSSSAKAKDENELFSTAQIGVVDLTNPIGKNDVSRHLNAQDQDQEQVEMEIDEENYQNQYYDQ